MKWWSDYRDCTTWSGRPEHHHHRHYLQDLSSPIWGPRRPLFNGVTEVAVLRAHGSSETKRSPLTPLRCSRVIPKCSGRFPSSVGRTLATSQQVTLVFAVWWSYRIESIGAEIYGTGYPSSMSECIQTFAQHSHHMWCELMCTPWHLRDTEQSKLVPPAADPEMFDNLFLIMNGTIKPRD